MYAGLVPAILGVIAMYAFIEHLFLETGFPVHVCLLFAGIAVFIMCLKQDG